MCVSFFETSKIEANVFVPTTENNLETSIYELAVNCSTDVEVLVRNLSGLWFVMFYTRDKQEVDKENLYKSSEELADALVESFKNNGRYSSVSNIGVSCEMLHLECLQTVSLPLYSMGLRSGRRLHFVFRLRGF